MKVAFTVEVEVDAGIVKAMARDDELARDFAERIRATVTCCLEAGGFAHFVEADVRRFKDANRAALMLVNNRPEPRAVPVFRVIDGGEV